jgi:hypothetical protein
MRSFKFATFTLYNQGDRIKEDEKVGACITDEDVKDAYTIFIETLKEEDLAEDIEVHGI